MYPKLTVPQSRSIGARLVRWRAARRARSRRLPAGVGLAIALLLSLALWAGLLASLWALFAR